MTEPPTFRARCPEDLIAVAPILMGFHLDDSVVMITSDADRQFHARAGLPDGWAPPGWADQVAGSLLDPAQGNGVRSLAFVFFSGDEAVVRRAWGALRRRCESAGIRVLDALRVDGRRYYPLLARSRRLREIGVPYDVSAHPFAVEAVVQGMVVERDRDALVATTAPDPVAQAAVEELLAATARDHGEPADDGERLARGGWIREVVAGHLDQGTRLTDEEVARAAWTMRDTTVRDAAWTLMSRDDARRHQELWLDVARRTPDRLAPAPVTLFGWAAWLMGNGALAWTAVDRCRSVDPDYGLAALLADSLTRALPPEHGEPGHAWTAGLSA